MQMMETIKRAVVAAAVLLACTGCDKAKEWLDFGEAQKGLPEKRDPAQSIKPLQTGKWRFDPNPVQVGFTANWQTVAVSSTPMIKPSSDESKESQSNSGNSSSSNQGDQAKKQPEQSVAPSFVCAFNQKDKLFCGKLQPNINMVRMVEVDWKKLPQNPDPTQLKMSAGHVCVKTTAGGAVDRGLFCGRLQQADKPVVMRPVRQGGADKTGVDRWELSETHLCAMNAGGAVAIFANNNLLSCGALPTRLDQTVQLYSGQVLHGTPEKWTEARWNNWFALSGSVVCSTLRKTGDAGSQRLYCVFLSESGATPLFVEEEDKASKWSTTSYKMRFPNICGEKDLVPREYFCGILPEKPGAGFQLNSVATADGTAVPYYQGGGQNMAVSRTSTCLWHDGTNALYCGLFPVESGKAVVLRKVNTGHLNAVDTSGEIQLALRDSRGSIYGVSNGIYIWSHFYINDKDFYIVKPKEVKSSSNFTNSSTGGIGESVYRYYINSTKKQVHGFNFGSGKEFMMVGSALESGAVSLDSNDYYACGIQEASAGSGVGTVWCWPHQTYESPQESE